MKVLIGTFINEANENIPVLNETKDFSIAFGDECIDKMEVRDIFEDAGIEIIPSILAVSGASGVIRREAFDYIESCFLEAVRKHLKEIDGIYLMLHGASEVEGLGSGDHHILWEIRKITGPYLPITVACDPHGNLCQEYVEQITALRSYRESPHTDARETRRKTAQMLVDLLNDRQNIHSVYRKLPMILGGEQSVSTDEPVKTINAYMDEMEKDPRIRSASWHVGYIRHDTDVAGCGIVVVPQTEADQQYAEQKADELAKFVWDRRHEFHYTGTTAKPDEALKMVLDYPDSPVSLTDSGDNTTSGAMGWNTYVLRQFLAVKDLKKSVLFATINDPAAYNQLKDLPEGTETHIRLGRDYDELSRAVELDVVTGVQGQLVRQASIGSDKVTVFGQDVLVHIKGTPIDVCVANTRIAPTAEISYRYLNVDWRKYDITVIKVGYNYPMFVNEGKFWVMSLTDGATPQDTASLKFKRIMRPMYPIDNI